MSPINEIYLYDRSRVVQDWKCPRSRFLGYEKDGKGLASTALALELFTGSTVHDAVAGFAALTKDDVSIDAKAFANAAYIDIFNALAPSDDNSDDIIYAKEQGCLTAGLVYGFHRHVWPTLMSEYPIIVSIEQEMTLDHDGLRFMAKPDLVVARDEKGPLTYIEYKTTSSKKPSWVASWNKAVQLHSTCRAIEKTYDREVEAVVVVGLYKGYEAYGKQSSPFCYGYGRGGNPPFVKPEIRYTYAAGFRKTPVWEMEGGVTRWIDSMPPDVLGDQFVQTAPIFINSKLVDNFFRQTAVREKEIASVRGSTDIAVLDKVFPQFFDKCTPSFGPSCQFTTICHHSKADVDPLTLGFQHREPHHSTEIVLWRETSKTN